MMKILLEFGREPELSKAEAEALFEKLVYHGDSIGIIDRSDVSEKMIARLGGTIRAAEIVAEQDKLDLGVLLNNDFVQLQQVRDIGFSFVGSNVDMNTYKKPVFAFKRAAREAGIRLRIIMGPKPALNAAQVKKNSLTTKGLEIVIAKEGHRFLIARSIYVQDVDEYSKRDYGKPCRDMVIGMLPPKLAQIAINLATGPADEADLYDPFCGSGTILQEALLMGHHISGSDIDPHMVTCAKTNLDWLAKSYEIRNSPNITKWDARKPLTKLNALDAFVTESTLGPIRSTLPTKLIRDKIFQDLLAIHREFLSWAAHSLKPNGKIVLMLPIYGQDYPEDILDLAAKFGYSHQRFSDKDFLLYRRPDQITGRAVIVLKKG